METKPISNPQALALTEKKVDMALDDIIKMSKINANKKNQRLPIKNQRFFNGNQDRYIKMRQYRDSRSTLRQGALAQKRSGFQGNRVPWAAETARKVAVSTIHNWPVNRRNDANWNKPRPGAPFRRQGNTVNGGNALKKPQQQKQQQQNLPRGEMVHNQKPKTLDSLFANMKEQRMRASTRTNNGGNARVGGLFNQPRQPWLRGRFGSYRN